MKIDINGRREFIKNSGLILGILSIDNNFIYTNVF